MAMRIASWKQNRSRLIKNKLSPVCLIRILLPQILVLCDFSEGSTPITPRVQRREINSAAWTKVQSYGLSEYLRPHLTTLGQPLSYAALGEFKASHRGEMALRGLGLDVPRFEKPTQSSQYSPTQQPAAVRHLLIEATGAWLSFGRERGAFFCIGYPSTFSFEAALRTVP